MTQVWIPLCALLVGCGRDDNKAEKPAPLVQDTGSLEESYVPENHNPLEVSSVGSDVVPTVLFVSWSGDLGRGQVEYGLTEDLGLASPMTEMSEDHEQAVLGLKAGYPYFWRVSHTHEDGTVATSAMKIWEVPEPPEAFDAYEVVTNDLARSEVAGAFLVISQNDDETGYAAIIDGDAELVWWAEAEPDQRITRSRLTLDGRGVMWSSYERGLKTSNGYIHRLDLDGRHRTKTRALNQHHDFIEKPDGLLAFPSFEFEIHDVDNTSMNVASDVIRLAPEGYAEEEEYDRNFAYFADYPAPPWFTCSHMELEGAFVLGYNEWSHTNSIAYEPTEDVFYILPRFFDALLKIDATSGALIWQLGGIYGDFTSDEGGDLLQHSHFSHVWPGGVLLFDNGNHADDATSTIEYSWDEATMTVEKTWEYIRPSGGFTGHLGDARRLPGGNTLINYSPSGQLREVTPDGDVVWKAITEVTTGRVIHVEDLYGG